jgi:hypothetical protein
LNNVPVSVSICESLFNELSLSQSELAKYLKENRGIFSGELAKEEFKQLRGRLFHFDCPIDPKKNEVKLKDFVEDIIGNSTGPKNRKEKLDNLFKFLHGCQDFEGSEIYIKRTLDYYGKLYFQSFEELKFFLRQMQQKDLITYNEDQDKIQFTFYGLEYFDTITKGNQLGVETFSDPEYQIGLSFAGEDRGYVEQVAEELKKLGVTVFYDVYEQVDLWGKDLYQHLNDVYKNKCQYCIIFISQHYARKIWTKHELKSAQTKAFKENKEYILLQDLMEPKCLA